LTDAEQNRQLADHEKRITKIEHDGIIRDAVLTFLRWGIPIVVAATAIVVTILTK